MTFEVIKKDFFCTKKVSFFPNLPYYIHFYLLRLKPSIFLCLVSLQLPWNQKNCHSFTETLAQKRDVFGMKSGNKRSFIKKPVKIDVEGGFWNTKREIQQNHLHMVFLGISELAFPLVSFFMKPRNFWLQIVQNFQN